MKNILSNAILKVNQFLKHKLYNSKIIRRKNALATPFFIIFILNIFTLKSKFIFYSTLLITIIILEIKLIIILLIHVLDFVKFFIENFPKFFYVTKQVFFTCMLVLFLLVSSMLIGLDIIAKLQITDPISGSETLPLLLSVFASLFPMVLFSYIFGYVYHKFYFNNTSFEIIIFILNIIIAILFTSIIGLQQTISEYLVLLFNSITNTQFIDGFYNLFKISFQNFINIVLYWLFALMSCFQFAYKFANKMSTTNTPQNHNE